MPHFFFGLAGVFLDDAIVWTLTRDQIAEGGTLSYRTQLAATDDWSEARWGGTVVENAGEGADVWARPITGDRKVINAQAAPAPVPERAVRTESVVVRVRAEGRSEHPFDIPLERDMDLRGVASVYLDGLRMRFLRQFFAGGDRVRVAASLLSDTGAEIASAGTWWTWNGSGVAAPVRLRLPVIVPETAVALRLWTRVEVTSSGAPGLDAAQVRLTGSYPGDRIRLHVIPGADPWIHDVGGHEKRSLRWPSRLEFTQSEPGSRTEPANVIGNIHQRDGNGF